MSDLTALHQLCQVLGVHFDKVIDRPGTQFDAANYLIKLDLTRLGLSTLPSQTFSLFSQLQQLDVSRNKLKLLSDDVFNDCNNLTTLLLDHNESLKLSENR
jgi:Leucine-rich repeat (LRR) protein